MLLQCIGRHCFITGVYHEEAESKRRLSQECQFPDGYPRLRCHVLVLREVRRFKIANAGSDDPGGPFWTAEYRGRQPRSAATSSQTELRLVNVARSSLEELLLDFVDYLGDGSDRRGFIGFFASNELLRPLLISFSFSKLCMKYISGLFVYITGKFRCTYFVELFNVYAGNSLYKLLFYWFAVLSSASVSQKNNLPGF